MIIGNLCSNVHLINSIKVAIIRLVTLLIIIARNITMVLIEKNSSNYSTINNVSNNNGIKDDNSNIETNINYYNI